ncbi:MAG TPA: hypothetical protein PK313_14905, partial [Myxococcota bacterium]|nr:hypothetical protein [Myxococcota bacterium]
MRRMGGIHARAVPAALAVMLLAWAGPVRAQEEPAGQDAPAAADEGADPFAEPAPAEGEAAPDEGAYYDPSDDWYDEAPGTESEGAVQAAAPAAEDEPKFRVQGFIQSQGGIFFGWEKRKLGTDGLPIDHGGKLG